MNDAVDFAQARGFRSRKSARFALRCRRAQSGAGTIHPTKSVIRRRGSAPRRCRAEPGAPAAARRGRRDRRRPTRSPPSTGRHRAAPLRSRRRRYRGQNLPIQLPPAAMNPTSIRSRIPSPPNGIGNEPSAGRPARMRACRLATKHRVFQPVQPLRGVHRESQQQAFAPRWSQFRFGTGPHDFGGERIGDNQADFVRNQHVRKVGFDCEIELVAPFPVLVPLGVGAKILESAFSLRRSRPGRPGRSQKHRRGGHWRARIRSRSTSPNRSVRGARRGTGGA